MRESETLESQNVELKTQLKNLEEEYKYLTEMWQAHQLECKNLALLGSTGTTRETTNGLNDCSLDALSELDAALKDTNNNKHLNDQLPSLTPLINCNVSFDFY